MRRVLAIVFAMSGSVVALAQEPTFRADTALVPILATVTDDDGRLVPDLTKADFEVLDQGKLQPIALFDNSVQPITVVVMLDSSASMTSALDHLRAAAEQFVIRLLPRDQARVCVFNDKIEFSGDFTDDRDALAVAVREMDYGNGTRWYDSVAASLDALKNVDGRKVILVFTDGEDTASRTSRRTIVTRTRAENVMVYAIGLETHYVDDDDEVVRVAPDKGLKKLAAETGGGYFELEDSSDLASTFRRVGEELHSQYMLGFNATTPDGRIHKLTVHVKDSELTVRARRTYLAAATRHSGR